VVHKLKCYCCQCLCLLIIDVRRSKLTPGCWPLNKKFERHLRYDGPIT